MRRVLMIALDGATLDLLRPWMTEGKLPLLARLTQEGAGGELRSTVPWATPTAFASVATGVNPGKHGVYDFGVLTGEDYTSFIPTNRRMVHGRSLWRMLSEAGLTTAVINMPMTYPAEEVNGILIAGIPYPAGSPHLAHPPDILEQLRQRGWDLSRNASDDLGGSYEAYYEGLLDLLRARSEATAWLLRAYEPDFTAVHFLETDQVQHRFWQFMPGEARHEPDGPLTDAILHLYEEIEVGLAQIIEAAGEDVTLCLMSDHGFGPTRQQVWLNNWLMQEGFLQLKSTPGIRFKKLLYRLGLYPAAIREKAPERLKLAILQFFERQKGRALASELEESETVARKGLMDWLTERLALDFYDLDWSRTQAFSTGTTSVGYIYVNLKGRDPQGTVEPGTEYEATRQAIAAALRRWAPVGEVRMREEVWQGAQLEAAPDLVVIWQRPSTDAKYFQTRFSSHHLIKPVPNDYAGHRLEGMFFFHGPGVKAGMVVDADILDLTPTFLWLLEQSVPSYMDGRVLTECFNDDHPVQFVEMAEAAAETAVAPDLSEADEAALKDTLRGLGYLE